MVIGIGYTISYFVIGVGIILIRSFAGSSLGAARDLVPRIFSWYTIGGFLILCGFYSIVDRKEEKERQEHYEKLIDSYRYKSGWKKE